VKPGRDLALAFGGSLGLLTDTYASTHFDWLYPFRHGTHFGTVGEAMGVLVELPLLPTTTTASFHPNARALGERAASGIVVVARPVRHPSWVMPAVRGSSIGRTPDFGSGCLEVRALPPELSHPRTSLVAGTRGHGAGSAVASAANEKCWTWLRYGHLTARQPPSRRHQPLPLGGPPLSHRGQIDGPATRSARPPTPQRLCRPQLCPALRLGRGRGGRTRA
jgi:hypothetical protein